tara:strand:+ start:6090 stop:7598 length:1509 start_codon:yes stop_codon:yes gene_type:complete
MNKNLKFIIVLSLLSFSSMYSQNSHFDVKESIKYMDQFKTTTILSSHSNSDELNVIARKSKNNLVFETFDKQAKGKKIKIIQLSKKESFVGDIFHNNKLQIFMVETLSKTKRILNCYTYNIEDNTSTKIILLEKNVKKKTALFSGQNKRQTNFSISPNKKYIAIATDNIKKNSNSYDIHVYDAEKLTLIYTKNYFNNLDKYYISSDMLVSNNAIIYSIGKEYKNGKRERKKSKPNYSYVLNKISKDDIKTSIIKLNEDEYIKSLTMSFYNDQIRLIGYYSRDKVFGIKGVSIFNFDKKNLSVTSKKKQKLPVKVFEDLYGYRNAKNKKDSELTSFYLDHTLEDKDGNVYLIAEEFYTTQTYVSYGVNGGGGFVTTYHYDDLLITKLNKNGNLVWGRSIYKRSNEASYNVFLHNDQLHVLLNSGKNLLKKNDGRLKVSKGWFESSSLYLFLYDNDGNVTHQKIQDNKGKTFYIPYRGSYSKGKFVMYNHSKKRKQIMMLTCIE